MVATFAWIVIVVVVATGSVAHAVSPEKDKGKEVLTDSSGTYLSTEMEGRFSTLYEPSGIVPLNDGRFLVVEDEPDRALRLITAKLSGNTVSLDDESRLEFPSSLTERLSLGVLDDLEGAAHDQLHQFYVISSHDDAKPYWSSKRQKLLRFSIRDGRMHDVSRILTLRRDLLAHYPQLANNAQEKRKKKADDLNIESLAYDRSRDVLLIGLRTPLLEGKSIIIRLLNPDDYFNEISPPEMDDALWLVDLDKGGLRAMTYDDQTDLLLLVSRREDHKDDAYKLWRLPANGRESAVRIKIGDHEDMLENVEGLAPIDLDPSSGSGVLFVRDNGKEKKGRGADWFVLSRQQLGLDAAVR